MRIKKKYDDDEEEYYQYNINTEDGLKWCYF